MKRLEIFLSIGIALAASSSAGGAQQRKIRVIGPDSTPIMYAYVAV
jgi:hypothetical protein